MSKIIKLTISKPRSEFRPEFKFPMLYTSTPQYSNQKPSTIALFHTSNNKQDHKMRIKKKKVVRDTNSILTVVLEQMYCKRTKELYHTADSLE